MEQSDVDFTARAPHPALRHLVRRYIGYTQHGVSLPVHRGLPSGTVTLIISLAEPIRVIGGPGGARDSQALVGGLHLEPTLIRQDSFQQGIHLELNPIGLRALLGVPATDLTSDVVDLADLPARWAPSLPGRLAAAPTWDARFALLDAELAGALRPVNLVAEVQWAWRRMVTGRGARPVTDLADEVGWSRRHFTSRFSGEVGLGPKQVSRLIRFEHSTSLVRAGRSLTDTAVEAGYYDQAHMTNEWRALAGCTPATWVREELPFLQDLQDDDPAQSLT
ncbi:helix-turn-helix domain-containing protein [Kibdelosporangium phytohabitans]|uniref:AraC family transcriptional regulator n=1 Tax=Kibdelosporangium phytohabitans TaxID=860235 RepID=A0A0N9IDM8_9PSEU|nr:helix-turn-helix domain-containing protein [Kibdelosporangium phytohabitans]ALG12836.1 AraC family transcriptional regulator [Kibdelosporangium phytohabitans]MBE1464528.1 AraC-like DNA-binding protein [Kibdelosporangium phytohabitans]